MKKHFILWADDDPDDRALFRKVVEQVDQHTLMFEAQDGREVLACLKLLRKEKNFPCLVILDMNMPALGGRETIGLMKQEEDFAAIPIAVFTTSNQMIDRNFCDRFGVPLFTKPTSIEEIRNTIEQLLTLCRCNRAVEAGLGE